MRMLILGVLLLAGCAATEKPASVISIDTGSVKERGKGVPGQHRKCADDGKADCPSETAGEKVEPPASIIQGWIDVSGKGRGESMLYRDSAACQENYRQALAEARQMYPEPQPDEACQDCGTRNAKAVISRQQNVKNYADAAYGECMAARGWRRK